MRRSNGLAGIVSIRPGEQRTLAGDRDECGQRCYVVGLSPTGFAEVAMINRLGDSEWV